MGTKFKFDKFIKDIRKREKQSQQKIEEHLEGQEELPQRVHNRLYREKWQNSTRFIRGKK